MKQLIANLSQGISLTPSQVQDFFLQLQEGDLYDLQIAAFLSAMQTKGIVAEELLGAYTFLQSFITPEKTIAPVYVMGTGKTKKPFNISTCASIIASSKVPIIKQSSFSISSSCGSSDILEALNIPLQNKDTFLLSLQENKIAFLPSSSFHPIFEKVETIRRVIQIPTLFDLVAPLLTLTEEKKILMGVYSEQVLDLMYEFLSKVEYIDHILCLFGKDGIDELSITDTTLYVEKKGSKLIRGEISIPSCISVSRLPPMKNSWDSSEHILSILQGVPSSYSDQAALNTGAIFYLAGEVNTIFEGYEMAKEILKKKFLFDKYLSLQERTVGK